ncbi:MAG: hypothetical protein RL172_24 [Bacteroidota bacterium]|jgi:ribosomal protein S1
MSTATQKGTITFVHHEKGYATIEYLANGKKKTINGNVSEAAQQRLKEKKLIKKVHAFRIGDAVSFVITAAAKGDRMIADNIEFLYNNAFSNLLGRAKTENRFTGYLKKVDDQYFVKETTSYISFPLQLSAWEIPPADTLLNEPIFFTLNNIEKEKGITATLFRREFIAEFGQALKHFKNKTPLPAYVYKVTPHGVFVDILNHSIKGKLPANAAIKTGDNITVLITYLSAVKMVLEQA